MAAPPTVSVILPVYNEAGAIDECLGSLAAQDYPGPLEILVADGGSSDGTLERLKNWQQRLGDRISVLDNPLRLQSDGLNLAAKRAKGEILVRADGHTTYATDYVTRSVAALIESGAAAVGGRQLATSDRPFGKAVAAAMASRLAVGTAAYRHATSPTDADTVYLGAYRKTDFDAVGGYRSLPSRVAEDADFYFRLRRTGGRVVLDPSIRSRYRPREDWAPLTRQFYAYGVGKADLLYLNGAFPSWRPLAPLALVVGLTGTGALAVTGRWVPFAGLAGLWGAAVGTVAARSEGPIAHKLRVALVTATMHLTYGTGLLLGLLTGPGRLRAYRGDKWKLGADRLPGGRRSQAPDAPRRMTAPSDARTDRRAGNRWRSRSRRPRP